jgi:hypothetical protein
VFLLACIEAVEARTIYRADLPMCKTLAVSGFAFGLGAFAFDLPDLRILGLNFEEIVKSILVFIN